MPKALTEAQRDGYLRDGLAFPVAALSVVEAQRYRSACDQLEVRLGGKPRTIEVRQMHLHWNWAHELATHPVIVAHGSSPNLSDEKRVGFVIRFVTPDAGPVHGRPAGLLARGTDTFGHFSLAEPPRATDETEALEAMRVSAQQHLDVVLENLKHAAR
ncbi:MAG: hypothetical protein L0241_30180 [Planctomycetia bacterium]|nr:hypothetical protein [Planctomycetia bacterium]